MKIYVASSWRCEVQASIVARLRAEGHEVYDFKNPQEIVGGKLIPVAAGEKGFGWRQVSDKPPTEWTAEDFRVILSHPIAEKGFQLDMNALMWCDACVLVRPCGRSAHLELGYAVGAKKLTIVLLTEAPPFEPELMYKMCDAVCVSMEEVISVLKLAEPSRIASEPSRPSFTGGRTETFTLYQPGTASFKEMQAESFQCAKSKGWWDDQLSGAMTRDSRLDHHSVEKTIPEKLCLIHSEVSEALEDFRENAMHTISAPVTGKPLGFPTELADIVIRVMDLAGALEIDLASEIEKKQAFNRTRSARHGGKRA